METRRVNIETGEIMEESQIAETIITSQKDTALVRTEPGGDPVIQGWATEIMGLRLYAMMRTVTNLQDNKSASEDLASMKVLKKAIEACLKEWLIPLKEHERHIKEKFDLLLSPLGEAIAKTETAILAYMKEQERIHKEQERIVELQRQANDAKVKLAQETGQKVVDLEVVVEPTMEPAKTVRTEIGMTTMVKRWAWRWKPGLSMGEIMQRLPLGYHVANETLIGQAVRAKNKTGITEADFGGVIEIYEETGLSTTARK